MKTRLLFFIFCLPAAFSFSQSASSTFLTWMKGDNTINQPGIYGTQGIPAATNKPGARDFSATWKDNNGNLWLFGGHGYDNSSLGYLNDLWKYNPALNQWSWVKGSNIANEAAVYGTQGIPATTNKPGAIYAGIAWTDNNGNLWLFGGFGNTDDDFGFLNDLWKYNPATNEWTWIQGDKTINQPGRYGVPGTGNNNNKPGARYGSRTWTDNNGNLWLFGGYGLDDDGTTGYLNDLWKYNPVTNQWTWMKGDKLVDKPGVYGIQGTPSISNKPGARYVSVSWKDSNDNFWLFGGNGLTGSIDGTLNDLWKYSPATNQWTWIKGDSLVNRTGVYGTQGVAGLTNNPGARYIAVSWTDMDDDLWLFGGYGYDTTSEGYLNDLWKYSPSSNQWTWVKGDRKVDQPGIYGMQGIPSVINKSGSRTSCVSWTGGSGDLWLFGGYGFDTNASGVLNDLWKISDMGSPLPLQLLKFNGVMNNGIVHLNWQTEHELNLSHFFVERSNDGVHFTDIGLVNASGNPGKSDYSFADNNLQSGNKLFYRLRMTDKDGHFTLSKIIRFDPPATLPGLHLFPNPATNSLNLSFDQDQPGTIVIRITDMTGKRVLQQTEDIGNGRAGIMIDISRLSPAAYILSLTNTSGTISQKFSVTK